jgi:hypothetical protein
VFPPLLRDHPSYAGQQVCLATMHGKERATGRPFRLGLGVELVLPPDLDTDSLGTFTGESARPADAATTCRIKAEAGMANTGLPLGLASEGSFGPHPAVPLLAVGHEWMTFVDGAQGLVVTEQLLCWRTNFSHCLLAPGEDPAAWLQRVGFPVHAVIVRPNGPAGAATKGIQSPEQLTAALQWAAAHSNDGRVLLETDMRAHLNPTRMASIRRLAFRLVRRIRSRCPECSAPGWGWVEGITGLPCGWCGEPTPLIRLELHGCGACGHRRCTPRRDGKVTADPGQCPHCNP